jgi:hypothetical protein
MAGLEQLQVGCLLLQGRSASDRAEAFQVDGVDGKFRAPKCHPFYVAVGPHYRFPRAHRQSIGSWDGCRVDCRSRLYRRFVPNMRPSLFTHGMRATPNKKRNVNNPERSEVALGTSAALSFASPWLLRAGLGVRQ